MGYNILLLMSVMTGYILCQQLQQEYMIEEGNLVYIQPTGFTIDSVSSYKFKFDNRPRQFCSMGDTTFIVSFGNTIRHINHQGKRIQEQKIGGILKFLALNQHQVLIFSSNQKTFVLSVWNLRAKYMYDIEHPPTFNQNRLEVELFVFKNTQLLCISEKQPYKKDEQQLLYQFTYYQLPLMEGDRPVHRYKYSPDFIDPTTGISVIKANEYSMLAILVNQYFSQSQVHFQTYSIQGDRAINRPVNEEKKIRNGQLLDHKFKQWFSQNVTFASFTISDLCETRPLIFYIQCRLTLIGNVIQFKTDDHYFMFPKEQFHTFYWSFPQQQIIASKLNILSEHRLQFVNCIRDINTIRKREISQYTKTKAKGQYSWQTIHRTEHRENTRKQNVPVYYVKPQTEQIICAHPYKNKTIQNIQWSNQGSTVFSYQIDQKELMASVHIKKLPDKWCLYWLPLKILCVFFASQIITNCDDDLLHDISELLPNQHYEFQPSQP